MKSIRIQIVLIMAMLLNKRGSFTEADVYNEIDISKSSFNRAISDYRSFLIEHNNGLDLMFDGRNKCYRLVAVTF